MTTVGSSEAKAQLSHLLERAARGEKILITKHGQPIAMLIRAETEEKMDVREVIRRLKEFCRQEAPTLGPDLTIRDLINQGRRF